MWRCPALLAVLLACTQDASETPSIPVSSAPPAPVPTVAPVRAWRANPTAGVRLSGDDPVEIAAGPHTIAFPRAAQSFDPPFTIQATTHKRRGRLHEGYGLVFGGENLAAPEAQQAYSYFLVRGDGSFLIKKREGSRTSVVRDWTHHPAVPRGTEEGGQPVEVSVQVDTSQIRFAVAGQPVASIPAAEMRTRGQVGVRVAHGVQLSVSNFRVRQGK